MSCDNEPKNITKRQSGVTCHFKKSSLMKELKSFE